MANMTGDFAGTKITSVEGYRISALYVPAGGGGFNGNIRVSVFNRLDAQTPLKEDAQELGQPNSVKVGKLVLTDSVRTYAFEEITLGSIEAGATRNQRYQVLQFRYTSNATPTISLTHGDDHEELGENLLKDDYTISLGDRNENLLAFHMSVGIGRTSAYRFSTLRSSSNAMLKKLLDIDAKLGKQQPFPSFDISTSLGSLPVKPKVGMSVFIEESYGAFLNVPGVSIDDLRSNSSTGASLNIDKLYNGSLKAYSSGELVVADRSDDTEQYGQQTVQTITIFYSTSAVPPLMIK